MWGKGEKITKEQEYKTVDKAWILKVCTQTRVVRKEKFSWLSTVCISQHSKYMLNE